MINLKIPFEKLDRIQQNLVIEAENIIKNSYDPYSQFYVGATVLTKRNNIYKGVNINICAYGSLCAERVALGQAISNGEYEFKKIAIVSKFERGCVNILSGPCGTCRQMIWEFAELERGDIEIIIVDSKMRIALVTSIKKLHPYGFGPRLCDGKFEKYLSISE
jgi:cytidine deaminase